MIDPDACATSFHISHADQGMMTGAVSPRPDLELQMKQSVVPGNWYLVLLRLQYANEYDSAILGVVLTTVHTR